MPDARVAAAIIQVFLHILFILYRDNNGMAPLHKLAYYGSLEIGKLLLEHGATVDLEPPLTGKDDYVSQSHKNNYNLVDFMTRTILYCRNLRSSMLL